MAENRVAQILLGKRKAWQSLEENRLLYFFFPPVPQYVCML